MKFKAIGVSVIGPAHIESQLPNQDSISLKGFKGGWISAVCDGLGSHEFSQYGSKAAAHSVQNICRTSSLLNLDRVNQSIHKYWLRSITPYPANKSSSTCLYGVVTRDGEVTISQLGDGLILYKKDGVFSQLTPESTNYGNQTNALGKNFIGTDWISYQFKLEQIGDGVILMTDGVSDDLVSNTLAEFYESIYQLAAKSSRRQAKKWLQRELIDWVTPKHGDDKTLSAIFRVE